MSFEKSLTERIEHSKPSLLEDFDRCLDIVMQIEMGYKSQEISPREVLDLRMQMMIARDELQGNLEKVATSESREKMRERTMTGFQGLGGFNRYEVRGDGTFILSRMHTVSACRKIASELGVDITQY